MRRRRQPSVAAGQSRPTGRVSTADLQGVIDACPDVMIVVDVDYHVLLVNRVAEQLVDVQRPAEAGVRCFQVFHGRELPCAGACPLREVVARKVPVTVLHTHHDGEGRLVFLEVTAAPILNADGDVVQVVESCRDVTGRKRLNRLLEIANGHMEMQPLLEDLVAEIKEFTGCAAVGVCVFDELSGKRFSALDCCRNKSGDSETPCHLQPDLRLYHSLVEGERTPKLPHYTEHGSFCLDGTTRVLSALSDENQERLHDSCQKCGCESLALVPIRRNGTVPGLIHVADPRPCAIPENQVAELESIACEMGTTLRRVCAEESLRAVRDELEARVKQRTAQLAGANKSLRDEINERARLEREILRISELEQQRIGEEMHDGLGQELTALGYSAQTLCQKLRAKSSPETQRAAQLAQGLSHAMSEMHMIVKGLISAEVDGDNLVSVVEDLLISVEEQTDISCRLECDRDMRVQERDTAIQVYRITQEAVSNAVKHGRPRHIDVTMFVEGDLLRLEVRDDGVGNQGSTEESGGCGLRTMCHRARAIGGELHVRSHVAGGTLVVCAVPHKLRSSRR